jgi:outer membrane protein OmpA-like peptidoglycan-associated protein
MRAMLMGGLAVMCAHVLAHGSSPSAFDIEFKRVEFPAGAPGLTQAANDAERILGDDEMAVLWELRAALLERPFLGATVTGYADAQECTGDACRELSLRRAALVLAWLRKHGVPNDQLGGPASESTDFPLNSGETEEDRARNRRVQLLPFVVPGMLPGGP